jgi:DNA-binding transcriptional LysR family regulator
MRIDQIRQFLEVANTGNVSKAAENLYLSQPSLSLSIRKLEDELGRPLFIRTTRGLTLTDFGREMLLYSENILKDYAELEDFCKASKPQPETFSIAVIPQEWIYQLFAEYVGKYDNKAINFSLSTPQGIYEIVGAVLSGKAELGIINIPPEQNKAMRQWLKKKQIIYTPLTTEQFTIMIGHNNPYFDSDIRCITKDMLKPFPLVLISGAFGSVSTEHQRLCKAAGLLGNTNGVISVDSTRAMHQIIEMTRAVALSVHCDKAYRCIRYTPDLRAIPLAGYEKAFELGWIKDENRVLSPAAFRFAATLSDLFARRG